MVVEVGPLYRDAKIVMPNLSIYKSGYRNFKNTLCLQNRPRGSAHCRPWRWRPQSWRDEGHCRESGRRRSQSRGIESQHPRGASRAEIPTWWCVWHRCGWALGNAWCWRWVFGVYLTINTIVNKLNALMYYISCGKTGPWFNIKTLFQASGLDIPIEISQLSDHLIFMITSINAR